MKGKPVAIRPINVTDDPNEKLRPGRMYCCGVAEMYAIEGKTGEEIYDACIRARHDISVGLVIATTSPGQTVAEKHLKEIGFKILYEGYNPRMSHNFKIWGYDVSKLEKKPGMERNWIAGDSKKGGALNVESDVWVS